MIRAFILTAALSAALSSVSSLALAQDTVAPATAPAETQVEAPAEAAGSAEAEFQSRAEVFGGRMQTMAGEMQAAIINAGGDNARKTADLDAIEARYQADVDDFALALEAFVNHQAAAAPEAERAALTASVGTALPQIRSYPRQIRAQVEAALVRATAAAAAQTQPSAPN